MKPQVATYDGTAPPPRMASVETTMYCNLRCPMCVQYQNGTTVSGPHMELDTFLEVAGEVFPVVDRAQFSVSGEPLMSKRIDRLLEVAEEHGVRVEYFTNGTLLGERMLERILPSLGRLHVSFDGATPETFERMREGAEFDKVVVNVRRAVEALGRLPADRRPPLGFACTLMEWNVRELPALVELAHSLGVDFVVATHVTPVTAESQRDSLARHPELAAEWIAAAARRAEELGMPLTVQPLGELIHSMATADEPATHHDRELPASDSGRAIVPGVSVLADRVRPWPEAPVPDPRGRAAAAGREERRARFAPSAEEDAAALPERILTCEYLRNRVYVGHSGDVNVCCMPGNPMVGSLKRSSLLELWNGPIYRTMRLGLAMGEPAPVCRGCEHVREVGDPAEVARLVGGRPLPAPGTLALPPVLRPVVHVETAPRFGTEVEPLAVDAAPRLAWPAHPGAQGYEVEFSLDGFRNLILSTAWHGIPVTEPTFTLPDWAWDQAPAGRPVTWRALALLPEERPVAARGALLRRASD